MKVRITQTVRLTVQYEAEYNSLAEARQEAKSEGLTPEKLDTIIDEHTEELHVEEVD